jgi:hypothetical protein
MLGTLLKSTRDGPRCCSLIVELRKGFSRRLIVRVSSICRVVDSSNMEAAACGEVKDAGIKERGSRLSSGIESVRHLVFEGTVYSSVVL